MKQEFLSFASTEMERKDFLRYVAIAGIIAAGGGAIFNALGGFKKLGLKSPTEKQAPLSSYGYGANVYGGRSSTPGL